MEELNNNVTETIEVEVIEPVEVLENMESIEDSSARNLAIGVTVITGALVAGGFAAKKLWNKYKAKKETVVSHTVVTETVIEKEEPIVEETK